MTLGRLFIFTLGALFVTASSLLVLGHVKSAEFEKLKAQADAAIKEANRLPSVDISPSNDKASDQSVPKRIDHTGFVKVNYLSKQLTAYYSAEQLIVIDYLDLTKAVVRREIFDIHGQLRILLLFDMQGNETQKDYFDEKGNRVDRYSYPLPPLGRSSY